MLPQNITFAKNVWDLCGMLLALYNGACKFSVYTATIIEICVNQVIRCWVERKNNQHSLIHCHQKFIWASKTRVRASKWTISLPDRASEIFEKRRALPYPNTNNVISTKCFVWHKGCVFVVCTKCYYDLMGSNWITASGFLKPNDVTLQSGSKPGLAKYGIHNLY